MFEGSKSTSAADISSGCTTTTTTATVGLVLYFRTAILGSRK
jgi:hypothetical protein